MQPIRPGRYPDVDRHFETVLRVWFPVKADIEGYSVGVGADDYSIYKTGNGSRPWVVHRHGKPVFRSQGNGKPFGSFATAIRAAAAVDRYELGSNQSCPAKRSAN